MDAELKDVHIGKKLLEHIEKKKMSKSEFARLIHVRQQHINRIFDSPSIDTEKLRLASVALDFNFFTYYVKLNTTVIAEESAISWGDGNATVMIGDAALSSKIKTLQAELRAAKEAKEAAEAQLKDKKNELAKSQSAIDEQLSDKKHIIELQDEKIKQLQKEIDEIKTKLNEK